MIQQKLVMPNGNTIWISPDRDLAHAFPLYLKRAIEVAMEGMDANDPIYIELCSISKILVEYVKRCVAETREPTLKDALEKSGVLGLSEEMDPVRRKATQIFEHAFVRVIFCGYYTGIAQAIHDDEKPLNLEKLDVIC